MGPSDALGAGTGSAVRTCGRFSARSSSPITPVTLAAMSAGRDGSVTAA